MGNALMGGRRQTDSKIQDKRRSESKCFNAIEQAGTFLRRLFPRYYLALIIGSGLAGALWVQSAPWAGGTCLVIALSTIWVRQYLVPHLNALRDAELGGDDSAGVEFARLHRFSVAINMIQLAALLFLLIRY